MPASQHAPLTHHLNAADTDQKCPLRSSYGPLQAHQQGLYPIAHCPGETANPMRYRIDGEQVKITERKR